MFFETIFFVIFPLIRNKQINQCTFEFLWSTIAVDLKHFDQLFNRCFISKHNVSIDMFSNVPIFYIVRIIRSIPWFWNSMVLVCSHFLFVAIINQTFCHFVRVQSIFVFANIDLVWLFCQPFVFIPDRSKSCFKNAWFWFRPSKPIWSFVHLSFGIFGHLKTAISNDCQSVKFFSARPFLSPVRVMKCCPDWSFGFCWNQNNVFTQQKPDWQIHFRSIIVQFFRRIYRKKFQCHHSQWIYCCLNKFQMICSANRQFICRFVPWISPILKTHDFFDFFAIRRLVHSFQNRFNQFKSPIRSDLLTFSSTMNWSFSRWILIVYKLSWIRTTFFWFILCKLHHSINNDQEWLFCVRIFDVIKDGSFHETKCLRNSLFWLFEFFRLRQVWSMVIK